MFRSRMVFGVALALLLFGCKSPGVAVNHRASDAECTQAAPGGTCACTVEGCPTNADAGDGDVLSQCIYDHQCGDMGANARCAARIGPAGCECTADGCGSDSDCTSDQTCACHGSAYSNGYGSKCVPSNCRVDADCGGRSCSPSPGGGCNSVSGYYCHTGSDSCTNDSDCGPGGGEDTFCEYSTTKHHWSCVQQFGCS